MKTVRLLPLLLMFSFWLPLPIRAQETATVKPYTAEVTGESVRLRNGPSLAHPPIYVLTKGEKLTVTGVKDGWATVRLPANAPCWISEKFVKAAADGKTWEVTGDAVNLRASAGTDRYPIGQTAKGDTLTACIDGRTGKGIVKEGWVRVIPPEGATGCVSEEFVARAKESSAPKSAEPKKVEAKPAPEAEAESGSIIPEKKGPEAKKRKPTEAELEDERKTFAELKSMLKEELQKAGAEVDLNGMRKLFEQFKEFSIDEKTGKQAAEYIAKIDKTVKLIEKEKARVAKEEAERKARQEAIARKAADEEAEDKGPVEYLVKGTIGRTGKTAKTPASHRLFDDAGKVLYDIRWDKGDLSRMVGKYVGITGKVKEYDGWPNKVIVIKRIDTLIQDDDK